MRVFKLCEQVLERGKGSAEGHNLFMVPRHRGRPVDRAERKSGVSDLYFPGDGDYDLHGIPWEHSGRQLFTGTDRRAKELEGITNRLDIRTVDHDNASFPVDPDMSFDGVRNVPSAPQVLQCGVRGSRPNQALRRCRHITR